MRSVGSRAARRTAAWSAAGALLLAVLALVGWWRHLPLLTQVSPAYRAISPAAAAALLLLGAALFRLALGRVSGVTRWGLASGALVVALYALVELVGFLVRADLNREDALTAYLARAWSLRLQPMSPVAAALMCLTGAALAALLLWPAREGGPSRRRGGDAAGALGAAAAGLATVFVLSYLYGAPLLYGSRAVPIAATSALGFLLLGLGIVAVAGPAQWPLRPLAGGSTHARLLRTFVPLAALAVMLSMVAHEEIPALASVNHALQSSLLAVAFAVVAALVATRVAAALGGALDRAQAAQQEAQEALRQSEETLLQANEELEVANEELVVTNQQLRESEEALRRQADLLDLSYEAIFSWELGGPILSWNQGAERLYGYTHEEAAGRVSHELLHTLHPEPMAPFLDRLSREKTWTGEVVHTTKDGRTLTVETRHQVIQDSSGRQVVLETNRDSTARKQAERERELTVQFLELVNRSTGTRDLVQAAATFFQQQAGCEAVGLRLKEGDDYPYYEARGFPEEFVLLEDSLCTRDSQGNAVLDSQGYPVMECMCGNVIQGRFDPSKPFFTEHGSFWTNNTTQLLATTTDADRQARTRNRCNGEGYESVALIPLRVGEGRLGLVQLNDPRPGRFTPETIALWERLGDYLAVALAHTRAEGALHESEAQFRTLADSIPTLAWWANADGYITWYNQRWYEYTGTTPEQMEGWGWQSVHDPEALPAVLERWRASLATGEPFEMEFPLRGADGVFRTFLTRVYPLQDAQGRVLRWFGTNTDVSPLKQAQEALQESERRVRLAQDVARVGTFDWDLRSGVNVWTPELEALYGLPTGGFSRTQPAWEELVHPEDRAGAVALVEQAFETGEPIEGEWRVVWPDGTIHWLAGRWQVLKDGSGVPLRMTGVNIDITARKQAEEALRRSEQRWATTLASIGDAVIATDTDGRVTFMNPAAESMTGWTFPEAAARPVVEVFHIINESTRAEVESPVAKVLRDGVVVGLANHTVLVRRDGTDLPIDDSGAPIQSEQGLTTGVVLVFHDISERRRVEAALRQANELLNRHVDNSPLATVEWDGDFHITRWAGEAERVFGWTAQEVLGKRIDELPWVYEEDLPSVEAVMADMLSGDRPSNVNKNRNVRKDGRVIHCEWYNTAILDAEGGLVSVLSQVLDVTERKQAEQSALSAERARAQLAEHVSDEISHRVKNNLAMISGLLQMQMLGEPRPVTAEALRDAIGRIRTFVALHEQMYASGAEQTDLLVALQRIGAMIGELFTARHEVSINVLGKPFRCDARVATNLSVIANELITNALKHGGPGEDGRRVVAVRLHHTEEEVILSVWNSGPPAPEDLDPAQSQSMGLRLVYSVVVEQYRGRFRLRPSDGGTLAEVIVPGQAIRADSLPR